MQNFAVILAAIAALAATGQAYLLWQDNSFAQEDAIHQKRVEICEGVIFILDSAGRASASAEYDLAEKRAGRLNDGASIFEYGAVSIVLMRKGYESIYLSESEFDALGLKEIEAIPAPSYSADGLTEDELKTMVDAYRAAADKLESAKAVCAPIMLGKVN